MIAVFNLEISLIHNYSHNIVTLNVEEKLLNSLWAETNDFSAFRLDQIKKFMRKNT